MTTPYAGNAYEFDNVVVQYPVMSKLPDRKLVASKVQRMRDPFGMSAVDVKLVRDWAASDLATVPPYQINRFITVVATDAEQNTKTNGYRAENA